MSQQTFPNGTTLTSTALTSSSTATAFQSVVAQIFGYSPALSPAAAWNAVRVGWQQQGQPAWKITDDVCVITATGADDEEFSEVRDHLYSGTNENPTMVDTMGYTQVWRVHFTLYGPNCFDRARLLVSALSFDWVCVQLSANNLYAVSQWKRPVYAPELLQGQWWERADVEMRYNEQVTETITVDTALGVDVTILPDSGPSETVHIGQ